MYSFIKYTDIHEVISYFNQNHFLLKMVYYRILKNFQQKEETEIYILFVKNSHVTLGKMLC